MLDINVNGAKKMHWDYSKVEIMQIIARCRIIVQQESLRCEDFTKYFFGTNSPLFRTFHDRLGWNHRHFLKFVITCSRLSANGWTSAKLFDPDHPQPNIDQLMSREEFLECWREIKVCGISVVRAFMMNSRPWGCDLSQPFRFQGLSKRDWGLGAIP
jgi:hypothetical protein